jgi:hypothetical protein
VLRAVTENVMLEIQKTWWGSSAAAAQSEAGGQLIGRRPTDWPSEFGLTAGRTAGFPEESARSARLLSRHAPCSAVRHGDGVAAACGVAGAPSIQAT